MERATLYAAGTIPAALLTATTRNLTIQTTVPEMQDNIHYYDVPARTFQAFDDHGFNLNARNFAQHSRGIWRKEKSPKDPQKQAKRAQQKASRKRNRK